MVKIGFFSVSLLLWDFNVFSLQECQIQKFKGEIETVEKKKMQVIFNIENKQRDILLLGPE